MLNIRADAKFVATEKRRPLAPLGPPNLALGLQLVVANKLCKDYRRRKRKWGAAMCAIRAPQ
jgi:hypothetical protein